MVAAPFGAGWCGAAVGRAEMKRDALSGIKVLVFGQNGQVARELSRLGPDCTCAGRAEADFTDPAAAVALIEDRRPDVVINAAAYTAVDRAETEPDLARRINADTPGAIAAACARLSRPLVHISTDYVFSGAGDAPWTEDAPTAPVNQYGASKCAGEQAIAAAGGRFIVLRTSWVFSAHGHNFVKTMLRLGAERDHIRVVNDQIGGPTPAAAIASVALRLGADLAGGHPATGIYHFAGAPDVSWAGFAQEVFAQSGLHTRVEPVNSAAYPTPARRPKNTRLDCGKIERSFGIARPDWRAGLSDVLKELGHAA